jgi:hypothetical protein
MGKAKQPRIQVSGYLYAFTPIKESRNGREYFTVFMRNKDDWGGSVAANVWINTNTYIPDREVKGQKCQVIGRLNISFSDDGQKIWVNIYADEVVLYKDLKRKIKESNNDEEIHVEDDVTPY